jgi:hypothetical protein
MYSYFPDAYYLHLTRHPIPTRQSMDEFFGELDQVASDRGGTGGMGLTELDPLLIWYAMHRNIIAFTAKLPTGQVMRLRGEDLLSEPDRYLPQIAEWLGVRSDQAAIEQMKHPESSPYACIGPAPARGGNDRKFMQSPFLRQGRVPEPSLRDALAEQTIVWVSEEGRRRFREAGLEFSPVPEIASEVEGLAQSLGYL